MKMQGDLFLNSALMLVLLVLTLWSLTIGPLPLSVADVLSALFKTSSSTGVDSALSETDLQTRYHVIVTEIRLPRALLAVLVGSSLGMSGAALQGLLRNPLADPGLLGVSASASLGVNLKRLRLMVIIGTALCVGASVAVAGAIGFIGLVVPHMLRRATDYHPARLLIASALGGAVLLLAADIVLRLVSQDFELMLGVVTSLIGAPFFLLLIMRSHAGGIR